MALFEKFLETCTLFMTPNSTKLTNLLRKRYQCADENYKTSAEFTDLLTEATEKVQAGDGQIFVHIQTVNHELKAYTRKNRTIYSDKKKSAHSETKVKRCILPSFEPIEQCSVLSALNLVPVNHSVNTVHSTAHSSVISSGAHTKFADDRTLFGFNDDDQLPTISPPRRRTTLKSNRADDSQKSKLSLSKRRREIDEKKSPKRSPRSEDDNKRSPRARSPRSPRSQSPRSKCLRVDHRTDEFVICSLGKKAEFDTEGVSYENDFVSISFNENSDSEKSNESTKFSTQMASASSFAQFRPPHNAQTNRNSYAIVVKPEPSVETDSTSTSSAIYESQFTNILPNSECSVYISPIKLEYGSDFSQTVSTSSEQPIPNIKEENVTNHESGLSIKLETDFNSWLPQPGVRVEDNDKITLQKEPHIPPLVLRRIEKPSTLPVEVPAPRRVEKLSTLSVEIPAPRRVEKLSTLSSANKLSPSKGKGRHGDRNDSDSGRETPEVAADAAEEEEEEEEVPSPKAKAGSQRQINALERLLTNIDRKIHKVKEKELSLDDLADEDSAYILEDKLEKKFMKVWNRLCELKGRDKTTGRVTEKKFIYQGTRFPDVNMKISKFVNKKKAFPNYRVIHSIISFVNEKKDLGMRPQAINDLAQESFQEVGNLLQNRRKQDYAADFGCHITDPISTGDPALLDKELRKKLEQNHKVGVSRLDQVISKYVDKQMTTGEVPQEFSHSDSDDNNVDVIIADDDDDDVIAAVVPSTSHEPDAEQPRASTPVPEDIKPVIIEVDTPVKEMNLPPPSNERSMPSDNRDGDPDPHQ